MISLLTLIVFWKIGGFFSSEMDKQNILMRETWKNKYAQPLKPYTGWWYFGIIKPSHHERFPFSSTIFVGFTDKWHFYKMLMNKCYDIGVTALVCEAATIRINGLEISPWYGLLMLIILPISRGIGFTINFKR